MAIKQEMQAQAPCKPVRQRNAAGKKTKQRTQQSFENPIAAHKTRCIRECVDIVHNWNVFCRITLSNVGFLNVCKAVSTNIDAHKKTAEIDFRNISHSPRAWVCMQNKSVMFAGSGFEGGFAIGTVSYPVPIASWTAMLDSIPGGIEHVINTKMVTAARKELTEDGVRSFLMHESKAQQEERVRAESEIENDASGQRHLPLGLRGVINEDDNSATQAITFANEVNVCEEFLAQLEQELAEELKRLGDGKRRRATACAEVVTDVKSCEEQVRIAKLALQRARQARARRETPEWKACKQAMTGEQRSILETSDYTCIPILRWVYPWRCDNTNINYAWVQACAAHVRATWLEAGIEHLLQLDSQGGASSSSSAPKRHKTSDPSCGSGGMGRDTPGQ